MSYVPQRLLYVLRAPAQVRNTFGRGWKNNAEESREVRETFVVDAENPKTTEKAKEWARQRRWVGWQQEVTPVAEPLLIERPNIPFASVELVTLEKRSEGGRAWKVLVDGAFYVDLREDALLGALLYSTNHGDGVIYGPFQWVLCGSQLKILKVGGQEHQEVVKINTGEYGDKMRDKRLAGWAKYADRIAKAAAFRAAEKTQ